MKARVAIGFVGSQLDAGGRPGRWEKWRPTVGMVQQDGLFIDRLELIVDNHSAGLAAQLIEDIELVSPATEVRLHRLNIQNMWDFAEVYGALYEFAASYDFDVDKEEYLVNIVTGTHVVQIVWYCLVESRNIPAKLLQLSPHNRKTTSDFSWAGGHSIIDLDLSRYDAIANRFEVEKTHANNYLKSGIATRSRHFNAMIAQIEAVAVGSDAPVLLTGPTGAGKSVLAKRIYDLKKSRRKVAGAFVEVNCATLRGDQAMSALFGHIRGAFTGANSDRKGLLKSADKGVLFLDEIGELGLDEQAMILRAVEEGSFLPVGSDKDVHSDFILLAGTNRDLSLEVAAGRFRDDLLARLDLWTYRLPALRDRREDIEPNLDYELARHAQREGRKVTFNKEARDAFLAFGVSAEASWPANFRDLSASVTRMCTLAPQGRITVDNVTEEIERLRVRWGGRDTISGAGLVRSVMGDASREVDPFDVPQLAFVIETCRSSATLSEAGRRLFSVSREMRKTNNDGDRLRKYLAGYGLSFAAIRGA